MNALRLSAAALLAILALTTACGQSTVDSSRVAPTGPLASSSSSGGATWTGTKNPSRPSDNIDRHYVLTYAEDLRSLSFFATFSVSDTWATTVKLSSPARLLVNGQAVPERELMSQESAVLAGMLLPLFSPFFFLASGTHYYQALSGGSVGAQHIEWTDQIGQVFRDDMQTYSFTAHAEDALISPGRDFAVDVYGANVAGGRDQYSATLTQTDSSGMSQSVSASVSGTGPLRFKAADLAKLNAGQATLAVERSTDFDLQSNGSGRATGTSVYRAANSEIQISK